MDSNSKKTADQRDNRHTYPSVFVVNEHHRDNSVASLGVQRITLLLAHLSQIDLLKGNLLLLQQELQALLVLLNSKISSCGGVVHLNFGSHCFVCGVGMNV